MYLNNTSTPTLLSLWETSFCMKGLRVKNELLFSLFFFFFFQHKADCAAPTDTMAAAMTFRPTGLVSNPHINERLCDYVNQS